MKHYQTTSLPPTPKAAIKGIHEVATHPAVDLGHPLLFWDARQLHSCLDTQEQGRAIASRSWGGQEPGPGLQPCSIPRNGARAQGLGQGGTSGRAATSHWNSSCQSASEKLQLHQQWPRSARGSTDVCWTWQSYVSSKYHIETFQLLCFQ